MFGGWRARRRHRRFGGPLDEDAHPTLAYRLRPSAPGLGGPPDEAGGRHGVEPRESAVSSPHHRSARRRDGRGARPLSGRPAGALAGIVIFFLLAAAAAGAAPRRDVVVGRPDAAAARISASASAARYPVGDGSGASVAVSVTAACQILCTAPEPQVIAALLGTFLHGPEVDLLTVQLDTPAQIESDCGYGAEACYYTSEDKIILSGNDEPAGDGASREFVLAHEYGHHLAHHRLSPAPFPAAIDWGTPRWASVANVCQGARDGVLYPGDEGLHYFEDPGEAFAEAFARLHFPGSGPPWRYMAALKPGPAAFEAIRADALEPWLGRSSFLFAGLAPPPGSGAVVRSFRTPLDGAVSLRPTRFHHRYRLSLLSSAGHVLRSTRRGLSLRHRLNFTVCGQSRLNIRIRSSRRTREAFRLQVQRP